MLGMWPCITVKVDEKKSKCAGLAQENGFGSSSLEAMQVAGKRHTNPVHL